MNNQATLNPLSRLDKRDRTSNSPPPHRTIRSTRATDRPLVVLLDNTLSVAPDLSVGAKPQTPLPPSFQSQFRRNTSTLAFSSIMKFLNHIRSRSRLKNEQPQANTYHYHDGGPQPYYRSRTPNPTANLPEEIFKEIFAAVCPHSQDETYLSSGDSMLDGGCMLCDLRDLSHCAMVNREWAGPAQDTL